MKYYCSSLFISTQKTKFLLLLSAFIISAKVFATEPITNTQNPIYSDATEDFEAENIHVVNDDEALSIQNENESERTRERKRRKLFEDTVVSIITPCEKFKKFHTEILNSLYESLDKVEEPALTTKINEFNAFYIWMQNPDITVKDAEKMLTIEYFLFIRKKETNDVFLRSIQIIFEKFPKDCFKILKNTYDYCYFSQGSFEKWIDFVAKVIEYCPAQDKAKNYLPILLRPISKNHHDKGIYSSFEQLLINELKHFRLLNNQAIALAKKANINTEDKLNDLHITANGYCIEHKNMYMFISLLIDQLDAQIEILQKNPSQLKNIKKIKQVNYDALKFVHIEKLDFQGEKIYSDTPLLKSKTGENFSFNFKIIGFEYFPPEEGDELDKKGWIVALIQTNLPKNEEEKIFGQKPHISLLSFPRDTNKKKLDILCEKLLQDVYNYKKIPKECSQSKEISMVNLVLPKNLFKKHPAAKLFVNENGGVETYFRFCKS